MFRAVLKLEFVNSLGHLYRLHQHGLSEREWPPIEPYTRGRPSRGRNNRLFVNAVIYRVWTGIAWRDLPERFGPWNTVARRFPAEALGRSRGGFSSKLHAVIDALGNAVGFVLTDGHQANCAQLPALLDGLPQAPGKVLANKAYDTNKVLAAVAFHQAEAVIPPKANRLDQRAYDENLYADRNKVERLFGHPLRENGDLVSCRSPPACRTGLAALTVYTL